MDDVERAIFALIPAPQPRENWVWPCLDADSPCPVASLPPSSPGPWEQSRINTKLGIWSLGAEFQDSRPDIQSPQIAASPEPPLLQPNPWEARLEG